MSRAPVTRPRVPDEPRRNDFRDAEEPMAAFAEHGDGTRSDQMRAFARRMMRRFPKITDYLARN